MFEPEFVRNTLTPILAIVGALFGLIGTGIGLWNLWLHRRSHRVKVMVEVRGGGENEIAKDGGADKVIPRVRTLTIRVVNDSYFAITVAEVGLVMKQSFFSRRNFYRLRIGSSRDVQERRIEARHVEDFTVSVGRRSAKDNTQMYRLVTAVEYPGTDFAIAVYAKLVTGRRFVGGKEQLSKIVAEMKECVEANRA